MDRNIVYPGAIPLDTDLLTLQRSAMVSHGALAQAALGTAVAATGLVCTQTASPSLAVLVGPGSMTLNTTVDATAFGSLIADTTEALVKVGVNLASTTIAIAAPGTAGQSINYLIQGAFSETDATSVVLPYYNSSNPAVPYSGPANAGTPQNTQRIQRVTLNAKAGTAATTGTQTTPAPDSGLTGLYVVTIANGATTVVNANISVYPGAPFVNGMVHGRLLNVQKFTSAASGTYTATPGTNAIFVEMVGGGGAGGGSVITAVNGGSVGIPGAAGAFVRSYHTSGFLGGIAYTVGAHGVGAAGASGSAGTASTLAISGGALSAGGGAAGTSSVAVTVAVSGGQGNPSTATGGTILNVPGDCGGSSLSISASCALGGAGGASPFGGGGGVGVSLNTSGSAATAPGGGGSGTANYNNTSTTPTGGNGADGGIWIYEYS